MPLPLSSGDMMSTNHDNLNLLYVFADQWRAQAVGCAGADAVSTPHMDAFAKQSVICDNAVSTYPLCSPHRAALLTGRHPLSCGFWTNCKAPMQGAPFLRDTEITIGDVASAAGYDTAYIGKWHLSDSELNHVDHPASGASGWDAYTPPGPGRHGFRFWHSYGAMDDHLHPHYWENTPEQIHVNQWSPIHETDMLLSYLESHPKNRPFVAFLSWNPPHPPYRETDSSFQTLYRDMPFRENVPQAWRDDPDYLENRVAYFGAVSALDREFGRITKYLEATGLMHSTIVVLSADHGDMMGSHGLYGKNVWYDEATRIPLIIHDPRLAPARESCLFASEDHAPTLLELLGLPIPSVMEGISHAKTLREESQKEREWMYQCMMPGMPDLVKPLRGEGLEPQAFGWRAVRTENTLFVLNAGTAPRMPVQCFQYDLHEDPYQDHPSYPTAQEQSEYRSLMRQTAQQVGDPFGPLREQP